MWPPPMIWGSRGGVAGGGRASPWRSQRADLTIPFSPLLRRARGSPADVLQPWRAFFKPPPKTKNTQKKRVWRRLVNTRPLTSSPPPQQEGRGLRADSEGSGPRTMRPVASTVAGSRQGARARARIFLFFFYFFGGIFTKSGRIFSFFWPFFGYFFYRGA